MPDSVPKKALNDFTADREEHGLWKEVHPANAFIGYYLRLDLLSKENEKEERRLSDSVREALSDVRAETRYVSDDE